MGRPAPGGPARVHWAALLAVFLVALSWRVAYLELFVPARILVGDEHQYGSYALNLVRHGIYSSAPPGAPERAPDTYRSPGLPLLGAAMMALAGTADAAWYRAALYVQAVVGALTALLTVLLVRHWLPPPGAILAGLAAACWPHSIAMTGYFLTETLYAFTLVLALWLLARADARRGGWPWAAAGLATGAATAVNPVALPLVLLLPLLVAVLRGWRPALVLLAAAALLPAAWSWISADWPGRDGARQRAATNFVQGLHPEFHDWWFEMAAVADPEATRRLAALDADAVRLAADPGVAAELLAARAREGPGPLLRWYLLEKPWLLWDWSIRIGHGDVEVNKLARAPFTMDPPFQVLAAISKAANPFLVALAALGCAVVLANWRRRADPRALALAAIVLCLLLHTAVHVLLQAEPRYSIPLRPLQLALAVSMLAWLGAYWLRRRAAQRR